jgi:hypothetical protein
MKIKLILLIGFLYFLALFQTSFLSRFDFLNGGWSHCVNLVLLSVAAISLFEKQKSDTGFKAALSGGIFLDMFSENFFGLWILILFAASLAIKFILKRYVQTPAFW